MDRYIKYITTCRSSTTSMTFKLVMLLIKRKSSLSNCQNEFFMKQMFVLKEKNTGEKFEFFDLNTQENGKFNFCVTEHFRHMACSVIEINICSKDLQEIIIYKEIKKTLLQSTKGILSEAIIVFHVFMRKPVLQICAE